MMLLMMHADDVSHDICMHGTIQFRTAIACYYSPKLNCAVHHAII